LFELLIGQWDWEFSSLCELYDLELQLLGEFGFDHFEVGESLSGFWCEELSQECLFL